MTKVYRVEHVETRIGPWWHTNETYDYCKALSALDSYAANCATHEGIIRDCFENNVSFNDGMDFCGVLELAQIEYWFPHHIRAMFIEFGFVLRVYDVPDDQITLTRSMTQVGFYYLSCDPVETFDLLSLV